ncbi:hypothetical protein DY000_02019708 [Brassica cretica]|uniref:Uncharacterized protein n=1 Tax=Brassica cretica TaxID=69181 RepID=A0ABQ7D2M8_BRACR|nr:hypothetical protein DY000_02019708 [Brassica cretica]
MLDLSLTGFRGAGGGTSTQWWSLVLRLRGDGEEIRGGGHGACGKEATEKLVRRQAQED